METIEAYYEALVRFCDALRGHAELVALYNDLNGGAPSPHATRELNKRYAGSIYALNEVISSTRRIANDQWRFVERYGRMLNLNVAASASGEFLEHIDAYDAYSTYEDYGARDAYDGNSFRSFVRSYATSLLARARGGEAVRSLSPSELVEAFKAQLAKESVTDEQPAPPPPL